MESELIFDSRRFHPQCLQCCFEGKEQIPYGKCVTCPPANQCGDNEKTLEPELSEARASEMGVSEVGLSEDGASGVDMSYDYSSNSNASICDALKGEDLNRNISNGNELDTSCDRYLV